MREDVWLEEQHAETAHAAKIGGDLTGIFIMPIRPMMEQSRIATLKPSWVLPIGSPEVLNRFPIIFTIRQQKLFRKLVTMSYSLVRNPVFPENLDLSFSSSATVSSSRCLIKSTFISMSSS
jgi:hypothetical protein